MDSHGKISCLSEVWPSKDVDIAGMISFTVLNSRPHIMDLFSAGLFKPCLKLT